MNYDTTTIPRNDDIAIMTNDIRQTLGLSISTINNRFGRLCVSDNVNMFSLKKPVSLGTSTPDRTNNNWCKGIKGNYSIMVGARNNLSNSGQDLAVKKWVREKPEGGSSSPFRLYDFVGYHHKAKPPIYVAESEWQQQAYQLGTSLEIGFKFGEIPLVDLDLSYYGWDKNNLRIMAICLNTGLRFHCRTLLKDMSTEGYYIFENKYNVIPENTVLNFRFFIAYYIGGDIYKSTGDGTTIFNDNIFTATDVIIPTKSPIVGEGSTTYQKNFKIERVFHQVASGYHTVECKGYNNNSNPSSFYDVRADYPYSNDFVVQIKALEDTPSNLLFTHGASGSWFKLRYAYLDATQNTTTLEGKDEGNKIIYKSFNPSTGVLGDIATGYILEGETIYIKFSLKPYYTALPASSIKQVVTPIKLYLNGVFFAKAEFKLAGSNPSITLPLSVI